MLLVTGTGCGWLFGFHREVHNPKKKGRYPRFSKEEKLRGERSPLRDCYDVTCNELHVSVDPLKKYLKGKVKIDASAVSAFEVLQVDLYPNMRANSITFNGSPAKYERKHGAVFITAPQKIKAGERFSIEVAYEGEPLPARRPPWDGGFVWKKDKQLNDWIGVACQTEGASLWWPCKDENSDEADSTLINITVPAGLFCVSNGQFRGIDSLSSKTEHTYRWFVSYPINNYNVTLYIGKYRHLSDSYKSPVTGKTLALNHYVLPWNYTMAQKHFQQLKDHLAFFEKTFGEYPFYRDGFKLVESPYAGMEHQTAIAYGNGYKNDFNGWFDYIILHETAHEWWGNSLSASDLAHVWLQEGFATYSEALYVEHIQGKNAYLDYLYWQRMTIKNKRPLIGPMGRKYFSYKDGDVYMKGTWTLHTLRSVIADDPLFFDIIKTFHVENSMKQVTSDAFIALVNKKTGKDYSWFFKQYLSKRKAPFIEYCYAGGKLYYRWKNTDSDFVMPVELVTGNGKRTMIYPTAKVQAMTLPDGVSEFAFNDRIMLFGSRENKSLKRKAD
ncbi:MAG: M1 family metallopeptidase [Bacteroidota bacterium]